MKTEKLKILLIVPPSRHDFYSYLGQAENVDYFILFYVNKKNATDITIAPFIKDQYFWSDYNTPYILLDKIKPDRIVFFEMIDLRQIALIVASRSKKIPTFYLEHGAAGDKETAISRYKEVRFFRNKLPRLFKRLTRNFSDILSSKIFYYSVYKKFNSGRSYMQYLLLPVKVLAAALKKNLHQNIFRERVPDHLIVFSQINFEEIQLYTGIQQEEAFLTGLPFFDKYYSSNPIVSEHIVYIEHPYLENNILDWTPEHHRSIVETLFDFAEKNKVKLFIKLHPRSKRSSWDEYKFNPKYIEIIQEGDYTQLYLEARLILGFSSSLITGLLSAKKNIVLLGWHPQPTIFGVDFSQTGLCHISFSPKDLDEKYSYWVSRNLALENTTGYTAFLKRCNYPFDGKATERILSIITENEVS